MTRTPVAYINRLSSISDIITIALISSKIYDNYGGQFANLVQLVEIYYLQT